MRRWGGGRGEEVRSEEVGEKVGDEEVRDEVKKGEGRERGRKREGEREKERERGRIKYYVSMGTCAHSRTLSYSYSPGVLEPGTFM